MDENDCQYLLEKAAECRARAARARNEIDRTLWLELADEIASRLEQAMAGVRPTGREH